MYGFSGSVLVARNGQIVLDRGYGFADRERRIPNGVDTIFDVGSITKTFTAAAILQLEMSGKLKTSDPVSRYLGEFPQDKAGITIHHLLTHTAGLKLDAGDAGISPSDDPETFVRKAKASALLSGYGEKYNYSNLGYALLALIVERVSGQSWQTYIKEHLFRPSALSHTMLYGDEAKKGAFVAHGYIGPTDEEARLEEPLKQVRPDSYLWGKYVIGATGVTATVGDLYKWWLALRSSPILSDAARAKMFTRQAGDQSYGWNIREGQNGITRIHRGGLRGSFQSMLAFYENEDTVLIFALNNNVGESSAFWAGVGWANMERVITGKEYTQPPAIISLAKATLQGYAGEYELSSGGKFVVQANSNSLFIGAEGQDAVNLLAYAHQAPPKSQSEINKLSVDVVEWMDKEDLANVMKAGDLSEKELAELGRAWKAWISKIGALRSHQLLGSAPGSRGFVRTFIRLNGEKEAVVLRLLWDWDKRKLRAWGDDIPLPAGTKFWPESETRFVTFDFDLSQSLPLMFNLSADHKVLGLTVGPVDKGKAVYARKL